MNHPIEHFIAPNKITKGSPLKNILDETLVALIAESFKTVSMDFDRGGFISSAATGLHDLDLTDRGRHIAKALQQYLPSKFKEALPVFVKSLGPPIEDSNSIGLKPFFYFPHSHYIAMFADDDIESGLKACYHLTSRFTSEFSIRPLIIKDTEKVLSSLHNYVNDPDVHVRRLVSEGTRPRLPWAPQLKVFIDNPKPVLELLNRLKNDPMLYVRRSVANNLGDIAKDHLMLVLNECESWLAQSKKLNSSQGNNLRWVIRHALRHPDKKGDSRAREIRQKAGARAKRDF